MTKDSLPSPPPAAEDTIAPADVPLARRPDTTPSITTPPAGGAQGVSLRVIIAFGLLLLTAVAVFVVLPGAVDDQRDARTATAASDEPPADRPAVDAPTDDAPRSTAGTADAPAPFETLTAERERRAAQEILEVMLARSDRLTTMAVETWASDAAAAAQAMAERGDDAFLAQDYPTALTRYQEASDALEALIARGDALADQRIEDGLRALDARATADAKQAFEEALRIRADDPRALLGSRRAEVLPELVDLLQRARDIAADGALTAARALATEAVTLDGDDTAARELAARLDTELAASAFRRDMSEGFGALRERRFADAETAFERARARRPNAPEVAEAARMLDAERLSARIDEHRRAALAAEAARAWADAAGAYEAALELDPTLAFALEGRARTRSAATLVASVRETLAHPERLNAPGALDSARALLDRGRARTGLGEDFERDLDTLQDTLRLAVIPVSVSFVSNGYTDVRLLRVEEFGVFTELARELTPGSYVATGRRLGFRDVRIEFVVTPDGTEAPVRVVCNERI